ncbi:hypothetical protein HYT01_02580 [Candidatus Giovannonibacteria bacterium]|nr:hypothetical protein [Candidatus Giovannonibacteria bacterium]
MANELKNRIMKRVYGIWLVRRIAPKLALVSALIVVSYRVVADSFFVSQIAANFLSAAGSGLTNVPRFIASALNHADPIALIVISAAGVVSFMLAVSMFRSIRIFVNNRSYFSSNFGYKRELG